MRTLPYYPNPAATDAQAWRDYLPAALCVTVCMALASFVWVATASLAAIVIGSLT